LEKAGNSALESTVAEIRRTPGRPKGPIVEGILPKHRKAGMRLLLIGMRKGYFGKKGEVTIKGIADWAAEIGLFLTDEHTSLSSKTIELEMGELNRELYPEETREKERKRRKKKQNKRTIIK